MLAVYMTRSMLRRPRIGRNLGAIATGLSQRDYQSGRRRRLCFAIRVMYVGISLRSDDMGRAFCRELYSLKVLMSLWASSHR